MQQVTIQPPAVPGGPVTVIQTHVGVPMNRRELDALHIKRGELGDQLRSAQNRRKELADQLLTADASARPGIQARLKVLDDRLVRLESEIDRTGDLIANAPAHVLAETSVPPRIPDKIAEEIVPLTVVTSMIMLPIVFAFARLLWKRANALPRALDDSARHRLDQLQQAVDTIAIEVERISEGQRYVSKMLNDRAIGPEAIHASKKAALESELR